MMNAGYLIAWIVLGAAALAGLLWVGYYLMRLAVRHGVQDALSRRSGSPTP